MRRRTPVMRPRLDPMQPEYRAFQAQLTAKLIARYRQHGDKRLDRLIGANVRQELLAEAIERWGLKAAMAMYRTALHHIVSMELNQPERLGQDLTSLEGSA